MIRFKIPFNPNDDPGFYDDYCRFIFSEVKKSIESLINPLKYRVRQNSIINSSLLVWDTEEPPKTIDLVYYVTHCLEMVKVRQEYVIRLNDTNKVSGSSTKVSTLVRLLEYGNEKVDAYPLITRVLNYYKKNYKNLMIKFIRERMRR